MRKLKLIALFLSCHRSLMNYWCKQNVITNWIETICGIKNETICGIIVALDPRNKMSTINEIHCRRKKQSNSYCYEFKWTKTCITRWMSDRPTWERDSIPMEGKSIYILHCGYCGYICLYRCIYRVVSILCTIWTKLLVYACTQTALCHHHICTWSLCFLLSFPSLSFS